MCIDWTTIHRILREKSPKWITVLGKSSGGFSVLALLIRLRHHPSQQRPRDMRGLKLRIHLQPLEDVPEPAERPGIPASHPGGA
jgi:hypothetical protein